MTREKFEHRYGLIVDAHGLRLPAARWPETSEEPDREMVEKCKHFIENVFSPASTWTQSTSYGWKHRVEEGMGSYVTNGSFIVAALELGISCKPADGSNAVFKMKPKSPEIAMWLRWLSRGGKAYVPSLDAILQDSSLLEKVPRMRRFETTHDVKKRLEFEGQNQKWAEQCKAARERRKNERDALQLVEFEERERKWAERLKAFEEKL